MFALLEATLCGLAEQDRFLIRELFWNGRSEDDVARMHVGDRASVTVEPFPDRRFTAHVASIDPIPTVVSNVVTYEVTLVLEGDTYRVKPGMSVPPTTLRLARARRGGRRRF